MTATKQHFSYLYSNINNISNIGNMNNILMTRQQLQSMCNGQAPAGTYERIEGTGNVALHLFGGMVMQVSEDTARKMQEDYAQYSRQQTATAYK